MFKIVLLLVITFFALIPNTTFARTTPEDIVNSRKEAYEAKVKGYSAQSKQKIEAVMKKVAELNRAKTDELNGYMLQQGLILDEYERRRGLFGETPSSDNFKTGKPNEQARYWITFAHEAIDYQAAKIYIPNLTSEASLKSDLLNMISTFQSELNYARNTATKSQGILDGVIK